MPRANFATYMEANKKKHRKKWRNAKSDDAAAVVFSGGLD